MAARAVGAQPAIKEAARIVRKGHFEKFLFSFGLWQARGYLSIAPDSGLCSRLGTVPPPLPCSMGFRILDPTRQAVAFHGAGKPPSRAALRLREVRQPARPIPKTPASIIANVEGSGAAISKRYS